MTPAPTFTARTLLSDFLPWIVYGLGLATGHPGLAYAGGFVASLCQVVPHWRARRVRVMDAVGALFFLAGAVSTLALHSALFARDGSVLIWGALSVVAWGSLLLRAPFTVEYARAAVPQAVWATPGFRQVNVAISAAWGAVFVVNTALATMMVSEPTWARGRTGVWLQALPFVGTVFGIVFTNRFPQWVIRQRAKSSQPG